MCGLSDSENNDKHLLVVSVGGSVFYFTTLVNIDSHRNDGIDSVIKMWRSPFMTTGFAVLEANRP